IIDKRRPKANVSEIMNIIGEVKGKKVILVDDMIDTAGTITNAANALKERGAIEVDACCTHAVLSGPAIKRIQDSAINELLVLDTINLPEEKKMEKIVAITVADLFASAMACIHEGSSISQLFD
ncbi:MAG: ribose-phosphate diphosphokinase, partial [Anaerotignum sp.]|nr:ribose-phosphate diphosphokinase [Anaerotignum sp.]